MVMEDLISNPQVEINSLLKFLELKDSKEQMSLPIAQNSSMIYKNNAYLYFLNNPAMAARVPKRLRRFVLFGIKEKFKYPIPPDADLRVLREFYKPWNQQLENYLQRDLKIWNFSNPD